MAKRPGREPRGAFMCECGASLCDRRVSMSGRDYDDGLEPLFAHAHGPEDDLGTCATCGRPRRRERRRR